jgi:uncharacterized protein HemX
VTDEPEKEPGTDPARKIRERFPLLYRIVVAALAVAPAFGAYFTAAGNARTEAQVVKNKAESGYQVTRDAVAELQERIAQHDNEIAALKRAVRAGSKRLATTAVKVVVQQTAPPPAPLPTSLDKAAEAKPAPPPEPAKAGP